MSSLLRFSAVFITRIVSIHGLCEAVRKTSRLFADYSASDGVSDDTQPKRSTTSLVNLSLAADPRGRHIRSFANSYAFALTLRHEHPRRRRRVGKNFRPGARISALAPASTDQ